MPACYVVFGARLRPDGAPGPALIRRIDGALAAARDAAGALFLVTGGQPRAGRTEAAAMRDLLLAAGIAPARILIEDRARNTRASAIECAAILRARPDLAPVLVCSDRFHQPRCVWLLRRVGIAAVAAPMPDERVAMRRPLWLYSWVRELVAIPYDTSALLVRSRPR